MFYAKFNNNEIIRANKIYTSVGIYEASNSDSAPEGWYLVESENNIGDATINGIPASISRMRALLALKHNGYLERVEATISQIGGDTSIAYSSAQSFDRDSVFIAQLAQMLELTDSQVDELFIYANNIKL